MKRANPHKTSSLEAAALAAIAYGPVRPNHPQRTPTQRSAQAQGPTRPPGSGGKRRRRRQRGKSQA